MTVYIFTTHDRNQHYHYQQPTNLRQLREAIISACETLDQQIIQNGFDGMVSRAHRCIRSQGGAYFIENAFF